MNQGALISEYMIEAPVKNASSTGKADLDSIGASLYLLGESGGQIFG